MDTNVANVGKLSDMDRVKVLRTKHEDGHLNMFHFKVVAPTGDSKEFDIRSVIDVNQVEWMEQFITNINTNVVVEKVATIIRENFGSWVELMAIAPYDPFGLCS